MSRWLLSAGGPGLDRRKSRPARWFPARSRAGIQAFSRESPDAKSRGGGPPPPLFLWPACCRSLVLGLGAALFRSMGYYGTHLRTLIWELSFAKMLFSIFFLEHASQIGFSIPEVTAPRTYQRQRSQNPASGNERLSKPGVQGQSPGPLSPHFSGEMGTPRRAGGATGRCASRWLPRRPPNGYAAPCRPWQVVPLEPPQVSTCEVASRPVPGGDPGFL